MDGTDLGGVIYTDVVIAVAVLITDIEGGFFTGIAVTVGDFQGALRIFEAVGGHVFTVVFHISDPADIGDILLHAAKGGQVGELGHAVIPGDGALIVSGHGQYVGIFCFLHIKFAHGGRFDGREGFVGSQCLNTAGKMAVEGGFGQVDFCFVTGQLHVQLVGGGVFITADQRVLCAILHGDIDSPGGISQAVCGQICDILNHTLCSQGCQIIGQKLHTASGQDIAVFGIGPLTIFLFQMDLTVIARIGNRGDIVFRQGQDRQGGRLIGCLALLFFFHMSGHRTDTQPCH